MVAGVAADALDEEWKGYVVHISGRKKNKQCFPKKQGALIHGRILLPLNKGHFCYGPRRTGKRKCKSVPDALWMPIYAFSTCLL